MIFGLKDTPQSRNAIRWGTYKSSEKCAVFFTSGESVRENAVYTHRSRHFGVQQYSAAGPCTPTPKPDTRKQVAVKPAAKKGKGKAAESEAEEESDEVSPPTPPSCRATRRINIIITHFAGLLYPAILPCRFFSYVETRARGEVTV